MSVSGSSILTFEKFSLLCTETVKSTIHSRILEKRKLYNHTLKSKFGQLHERNPHLQDVKQGQTVHRTEVIDNSDKQKIVLEIRQTNLHTEKRADRKIKGKFVF